MHGRFFLVLLWTFRFYIGLTLFTRFTLKETIAETGMGEKWRKKLCLAQASIPSPKPKPRYPPLALPNTA